MELTTTPITTIRAKPKQAQGTLPPWTLELRPWQIAAAERFVDKKAKGGTNFLLVATPGAGKTIGAGYIAHFMLDSQEVERLLVVVPSSHLRMQWANALARVGIQVNPLWSNGDGPLASDYCGMVVTYQQVFALPSVHERFTQRHRTMVVFDEIHHVGEKTAWGEALTTAFRPALYRLSLSGTPFRRDNEAIPWVEYEPKEGSNEYISKADFSFGYGSAVIAGQVRPVQFPAYEGEMVWLDGTQERRASFGDKLSEGDARKRLHTALDPRKNWLADVLRSAHRRLMDVRKSEHPQAGGLVLAKDSDHARALAKLMKNISGHEPVLAICEEPSASQEIARFTTSDDPWIIAIKMVSEGVDIPRLRVAVYATNVLSELFFRQVVGRIVRKVPDIEGDQTAYLYIPDEATLREFAQRMKKERDHALQEREQTRAREQADATRNRQEGIFIPIESTAYDQGIIYEGQQFYPAELKYTRAILDRSGIALPEVQATLAFRALRELEGLPPLNFAPPPIPQAPPAEKVPVYQEAEKLQAACVALVNKLVNRSNGGYTYDLVWGMLKKRDGKPAPQASVEELKRRLAYLNQLATRQEEAMYHG